MRCLCCNNALSDFESTIKGTLSNTYLDMCKKCIKGLDLATKGVEEDFDGEEEEYEFFDTESFDKNLWDEHDE
jgi:hypothetical protein